MKENIWQVVATTVGRESKRNTFYLLNAISLFTVF
jgi:hypothetical protein